MNIQRAALPGRASFIPRPWLATVAAAAVGFSLMTGCKSNQPPAPSDQQLTSSIQSKIQSESALAGQNIQVSVSNGVATLSGSVSDDASRALAGNDSGSVAGVKTVVNNLTVQSAQQPAAAPAPTPEPAPPAQSEARSDRRHHDRADRDSSRRQPDDQQQRQAYNPPPPMPNSPPPMQQPAPQPPPMPVIRHVTLPAGTALPVILTEALSTKTAQPNDVFHGTLAQDLVENGVVAIPRGATVIGQVVDAKGAAHFKGESSIVLALTQVSAYGRRMDIQTDTYSQQGKARGKNTAEKTGGGALLGALIGGLAGGGKGAAIGAIAGGGAGAGVNAVTRGQEVNIPPETRIDFHLQAPVTITVNPQQQGAPINPEPSLQQR